MIDAALNFLYPPICQVCHEGRAEAKDGYVCGECWAGVRFITAPFCHRCGLPYEGKISPGEFQCENCEGIDWAFSSARSAVHANRLLLGVIHDYKYNRALWFESFLADLLARQALPVLRAETWDCLVPVPLHATKLREREFNQASRLAQPLAKALRLPVEEDLVCRTEATNTQTRLSRSDRARNVAAAFAPSYENAARGKRIILLDDVLTTGATTNACARALRKAGAAEICVWTLARGA